MKSCDDEKLSRLFKAAAAAPTPGAGVAGFALEARTLAAWRAATADNAEFMVAWFRLAAICALAFAVACVALAYKAPAGRSGGEVAVADSAMRMGVE